MIKLWHCPKCSARIVVTDLMEQQAFMCPECNEIWSKDDIDHFAIGLSEFDVADVNDWILSRPEASHYVVTAREQILLIGMEAVLALYTLNQPPPTPDVVQAVVNDAMRRFGDKFGIKPKREEMDWCEAQYQQEIESRQRERRR